MTRTLDGITLTYGAHDDPAEGMCAMEAAAYIAGEPHSDRPECVSPVVASFVRVWNDDLPDDATRTRLLAPLVPLTVGTRTSDADDGARAWLAVDWLVRTCAPAWLRHVGLDDHADRLSALAPVLSDEAAREAQASIDAATAAAGAAAGDAARAAAARDASWAAAEEALAPTVAALQESAQDLVRRMCAVGGEE